MNYTQAIEYIHSTPKFSRVLGNDALRRLLDILGNPQKSLRFIHIGGTNGKGSTAAMCESILRCAGFKTGLFTSPYIEVYNERIRVNGENIPDEALARLASVVRAAMEENDAFVSEFALGTAIAFLYFAEQQCDYVVLEVGMGGLLDATNVIDNAEVTAITSISLDHTQYLGDTIEKIAMEKCGIIRQNSDVIAYMPQNKEALTVIENVCREKNARLTLTPQPKIVDGGIEYNGKHCKLPLKGSYQPYNASLAIAIIGILRSKGADISDTAIIDGLQNVRWPARFEFITDRLIIDGSHNIDGMRTLAQSLAELEQPVTLVIAMLEDKSHKECLSYIAKSAIRVIATQIDAPRCLNAVAVATESNTDAMVIYDLKHAVETALSFNDSIVCVCGSLYAAGEARRLFGHGDVDGQNKSV